MPRRKKTAIVDIPAGRKEPAVSGKPAGGKKTAVPESPDKAFTDPMAWRFSSMDGGGLGKCTLPLLAPYMAKLLDYEKLTREEAMMRKHCHPLGARKISAIGKARIETLGLDLKTFHQLKLSDSGRLWGFWTKNVFNIVWLDKGHDFYITGGR